MNNNLFFALTGPSGAGKTTYSNLLFTNNMDICRHSITYTTRLPRPNEHNSEFFKFISLEAFNELDRQNKFVCTTRFCGNDYAYLYSDVCNESSKDIIMDSMFEPSELKKIQKNVVVVYLTTSTNMEMYQRIVNRHPDIDRFELSLRVNDFFFRQSKILQCDYFVKTDARKGNNKIYCEIEEIYHETRKSLMLSNCLYPATLGKYKITNEAISGLPKDEITSD